MGLVPDPPPNKVLFDDSRGWNDLLEYRTNLVHARNAQLEYQQNLSELHAKIRQACKDLLKKDDNVVEDIETLALERGRLGYLRDELARRADMLSRWENKMRESDPNWVSQYFPKNSKDEKEKKERDLFNAMVVELDHKRRIMSEEDGLDPDGNNTQPDVDIQLDDSAVPLRSSRRVSVLQQPQGTSTPTKPSSEIASGTQMPSSVNNTPILDKRVHVPFVREVVSPIPPETLDAQVNTDNRVSIGVMAACKNLSLPQTVSWAEETAERAFTSSFASSQESDKFFRDLVQCIDFLWSEYSTSIDENNYRLMSLSNMMRLCGDADFGISTAAQIEVFLNILRESKSEFSLVEYRYFLPLMLGIMRVAAYPESTTRNAVELTDLLFKQYLFPLMQRVRLMDRKYSSKHPPLPPSPIHSSSMKQKRIHD